MLLVILKRLGFGVIVVFSLMIITFSLVRFMPGNPLTDEKAAPPHIMKENMRKFKLDKPIYIQFVAYLSNMAKGDMGMSFKRHQPVSKIIKHSFPASLVLGLSSIFIAVAVGIPAGIIAALKKNSLLDFGTMTIAMLGISIPSFVLGPLLADSLGNWIPFLKVAGWGGAFDWFLPSLTLGLGTAAYIARITRGGMLEVLGQDYIRTAKAKGVSPRNIIVKHALRGGVIPAVAYVGPAFAMLLTGSFIVETIFQVPGMGQHFVTATSDRDYPLLQGVVLLFGSLIVIVNLASDVLLAVLNPRLKEEI